MSYRWSAEVSHPQLGKHRIVTGSDKHLVERKASMLRMEWDNQWAVKVDRERHSAALHHRRETERNAERTARDRAAADKARQREETAQDKLRRKDAEQKYVSDRAREASDRDDEAKAQLGALRGILVRTLGVNDAIDWTRLLDDRPFDEPAPRLALPTKPANPPPPPSPNPLTMPVVPAPRVYAEEPQPTDQFLQPRLSFFDKLFPWLGARKIAEAACRLQAEQEEWRAQCAAIDRANADTRTQWEMSCQQEQRRFDTEQDGWHAAVARLKNEAARRQKWWETACADAKADHEKSMAEWEQRKGAFAKHQAEMNEAVKQNQRDYLAKDPGAVHDYCEMVLSNSQYPDYLERSWELEYRAETRNVVVDLRLPAPDDLPTLKDVQYLASKDEIRESHLTDKERERLYDEVLYQIALRTIHELFEADVADALDAVVFNGIVTALDKSTGHTVTACDPDPIRGGKIVVQAKRYANTVGVGAVRDLYGTLMNEGANKGILVTTADYGPDAYEFAQGKPLSLLSGSNLLFLLEKHGHTAHIDLREARALNKTLAR